MNTVRALMFGASALAMGVTVLPGIAAAQAATCPTSTATTPFVVGAPEASAPGPVTTPLPTGACALGTSGRLIFNHNDNSATGYRIPQTTTITGSLSARLDFLAGHTALTRIGNVGGASAFTGSATVRNGATLELEQSFLSPTSNPSNLNPSTNPFDGLILGSGLTVEHGGSLTGQGAFGNETADVTIHGVISPHGFPGHANNFAGPNGRLSIGAIGQIGIVTTPQTNVLRFAADSLLEIDVDLTLPDGALGADLIYSNLNTVIEDGAQLRVRLARPEGPTTYLVGRQIPFLRLASVSQQETEYAFNAVTQAGIPNPQSIQLRLPGSEFPTPPARGSRITREAVGLDGVTRTYTFQYSNKSVRGYRELAGNFTLTADSDAQLTQYLGLKIVDGESIYQSAVSGQWAGADLAMRSTLYLEIAQTRSFDEDADTANGRAAAAALQAIGDHNPIFTTLLNLPIGAPATEQLGDFFNSLSGELHVGVRGLLTQDAYSVQRSIGRRLSSYEAGGAHLWAEALGGRRQLDDNGEAPTIKEEGYGVLTGIDATLTGPWRVGLAGGWRTVQADGPDALTGKADIKQWHAMAYTAGGWGNWRGQIGAGFSKASVKAERTVALVDVIDSHLAANYDGAVAHAFGELSYVHPLAGAVVEPFLGYSFVRAETDPVREVDTKGGGEAAALLISGDQNQVSFTTLGVKARTASLGPVAFEGLVGWRRGFGDLNLKGLHLMNNREYVAVRGANLSENAAVIEAGARWRVTETVTLDAGYDGVIGDEGHDHTARVGVSLRF